MQSHSTRSGKLLLQKQQISNAELADVRGGKDNTSKVVSASASAIGSAVAGGITTAPLSATTAIVGAVGSGAAGGQFSGDVGNLASQLSNPFNSF